MIAYGGPFIEAEQAAYWTADDWAWHVDDVMQNLLTDNGRLYLQFSHETIRPESWSLIKSRASLVDEKQLTAILVKGGVVQ